MSDQTPSHENLPKPQEILEVASIEDSESSRLQRRFEKRFSSKSINAQADYAHLKGLVEHYFHKKSWSWFLMGVMAVMIIFQTGLLLGVGLGKLDFTEYKWLLPALMVQNLGQVIALAVVVVKSLFK